MSSQSESKEIIDIHTRPINVQNIGLLKEINAATLPVNYQEKFYRDIVKTPKEITHYAYSGSVCIGAICCRVERDDQTDVKRVYIMTLAVLAPYRNQGVGTTLLNGVLDHIDETMSGIKSIYLHVWVKNEAAMKFYSKFDFIKKDEIKGYYKRVDPPNAVIFERDRKVERSLTRASTAY